MGMPRTRSGGSVVGWPSANVSSVVKPGMSPPTEIRSVIDPVPDICSTRSAKSRCRTSAAAPEWSTIRWISAPERAGLRAMDWNPPSLAASCQHNMSTPLGSA